MSNIRQAAQQAPKTNPCDTCNASLKNTLPRIIRCGTCFVRPNEMPTKWKAAQQKAEPVHGDIRALKYRIHELEGEVMGYKRMLDVAEAASQPQQQAEPVAWMDREGDIYKMPEIEKWAPPHTMLYTTPPQRQWVGLTDEDWEQIADMPDTFDQGVAWAQARLKEKNT